MAFSLCIRRGARKIAKRNGRGKAPFTFSIAEGIAFGFISYAAIKVATGRYRDVHPAVGTLAVLFVIKYVYIG